MYCKLVSMDPKRTASAINVDEEKKKYTLSEVDTRTSHVDEKLHSREKEGFMAWRSRRTLSPERPAVADDWHHEQLAPNASSGIPVLSTAAFVLSLIILLAAGWFGWSALSAVPAAPVATAKIEVTGKKTLQSGDVIELQIVVTNELPIPLELAELVISYPPGTFSTVDPTKSITEERQPLGTIAARSVRRGTVRSIVFGAQGEDKTIHVSLEYRASGASAIYQASADHAFTIGTSTFAIATEGLHEVVSEQTNDVTISVSSQAKTAMHDVVVSVVYPFGFGANEVVPDEEHGVAGADMHVWALGDFAPGETKKIYLRGVYTGEDGDVRLFKITAGTRASPQTLGVDTILATGDHTTTVKRPFLSTQLFLNGKKPSEFAFTPGEPVKATIEWKNTLRVPLTNVSLGVVVGGDALRKTGIKVTRGFYRSTDSQVLWDVQTKPETFTTVSPGAKGVEEFQIQTLDDTQLAGLANPAVTFAVRAAGKRMGETGVPESLEATTTAQVPVRTKATFVAEAKYFTSPFPQSGPLPPKVDTETVYAVSWRVASSSSDVDNAVVTATLPPNVRFRNIRDPISENLVYDQNTRTITWYLGKLGKAEAAGGTPGREVTFAVGLVPSASQLRDEPDIVTTQVFTGVDTYTSTDLHVTTEDLNTILSEEGFDERFAPVVE